MKIRSLARWTARRRRRANPSRGCPSADVSALVPQFEGERRPAVGSADSGGHVRNEEVVLVVLANEPDVRLTEDLDRDVGGRWHRAAEASSYLEPE
jgi:hypothetical protein